MTSRFTHPPAAPPRLLAVAVVILALAALQALPAEARASLRYDRSALLGGQLWRLLTGHLVHLGWAHWALNAAGLALCAAFADTPLALKWLAARLLVLALAVSLMLLVFEPQLGYYLGLSGVLYGLFVLLLWPQVRSGSRIALAALAVVLGWMGWQLLAGPLPSEAQMIGGPILTHAHLYGVVSAAALLAWQHLLRRKGAAGRG